MNGRVARWLRKNGPVKIAWSLRAYPRLSREVVCGQEHRKLHGACSSCGAAR